LNEKLYRGDPRNPDYILAYARDLRRMDRGSEARLVIRTPALQEDSSATLKTEAAMVLVSAGDYAEAKIFAEKAVVQDPASPDALQALALALSGMNKHVEAEEQFSKSLALWPKDRDKTPVINNLAMSQAAQGKVLEANATMALATGEALRSDVYQNNRAMLASLREAPVRLSAETAQPVQEVTMVEPLAKEQPVLSVKLARKTPPKSPEPAVAEPKISQADIASIEPAAGDAAVTPTRAYPTQLFNEEPTALFETGEDLPVQNEYESRFTPTTKPRFGYNG
jgi:Flp pilus assembly protein TadD